jgi:hypothetical protein
MASKRLEPLLIQDLYLFEVKACAYLYLSLFYPSMHV